MAATVKTNMRGSRFIRFRGPALPDLVESAFRVGEWAGCALATASTAFLLTYGLYWLISMYFGVYEATVAYLALVQFGAISLFVLFRLKQRPGLLLALGATEGIGILVIGRQDGAPPLDLHLVVN